MWRLYQFPLCPFSRKVRLLMSEKGIGYELWRENPWDNRDEFWALNPAGRTPVLHDPDKKLTLCDSRAICEYFEETVDQTPLIGGTARERAEIRRLVALFDESFFNDVTAPMLGEKMKKRIVLRQPPDSRRLSQAMKLAHGHLDYIDWLIDNRTWLAGPRYEAGEGLERRQETWRLRWTPDVERARQPDGDLGDTDEALDVALGDVRVERVRGDVLEVGAGELGEVSPALGDDLG